jgi:hypothetical protein
VEALLSGGWRVREYAFYNDVLTFHAQNDTDTAKFVAVHLSETRC